MPSRSSRPSSRRHCSRTRTLRSRKTLAPSSRSSSLRAAVPMSRIIRPPLPIRIDFCESVSAQTWARTAIRPSSRSLDLLDGDLDRVRELLAGAAQDLLADQLGEVDLARLVGAVLGRVHERPLRHQLGRAARPAAEIPVPRFAEIGNTSSTIASSAAAGEHLGRLRRAQPVDLVDRADHRHVGVGLEQVRWR